MLFLQISVFTDDLAPDLDSVIDTNSLPLSATIPVPWPHCEWTVFPAHNFEFTVWFVMASDTWAVDPQT